jgi:zinc resistance-associated protein
MRKVVIGTTAMMLLASAYAYAQQPPGRDGGRRWQPSTEDRAAFLDARLAALHAGLKLTPDQEKSWPAFEQAYRELAAQRAERTANESRGDRDRAGDPIQRAQRQADALLNSGTALKKYADAAAPLYQSLDDGQKQRFEILSRVGRPHFHRFAFWRNGDRGEYRGPFPGERGENRGPLSGERRDYRGPFSGERGEYRGPFLGQRDEFRGPFPGQR